jgi:hypothetical protein
MRSRNSLNQQTLCNNFHGKGNFFMRFMALCKEQSLTARRLNFECHYIEL